MNKRDPKAGKRTLPSKDIVQAAKAKRKETGVKFWAQSHAIWKESSWESTTRWILGKNPGVVRMTRRQPLCLCA